MKKTIMISFVLITFISCNRKEEPIQLSQYKMDCEIVVGNMTRCENKEAVCYAQVIREENPDYIEDSPSCNFKVLK